MAVLSQPDSSEKNYYANLFDEKKLQVLKPSTKGDTEFRPIPQIDQDGNPMPMVIGNTPLGLDYSNIIVEDYVQNSGDTVRYSGFTRSSDGPAEAMNQIFAGLYIRIKGSQKRDRIPDHIVEKVTDLLTERKVGNSPVASTKLARASQVGLIQCVALSLDGQAFDKPRTRQVIMLSATGCSAVNDLLTKAYQDKIDIFNPAEGYTIVLKGLPADRKQGRMVPIFTAELGQKVPMKLETCRTLWTPWETAIKRNTVEEHLKAAVKCFGRDIVEFAFPDECAQYLGEVKVVSSVPKPQPQVQTQAQRPTAAARPAPAARQAAVDLSDIDTEMPEPLAEPEQTKAQVKPQSKAASAGKTGSVTEDLESEYKKLLGGDADEAPF
jgi:hypothetical protein